MPLSLSILLFACNKDRITGNGNVTLQERNITGFNGVVMNGATKAFIKIDTGFCVMVKGYQNLLPYLETTVVNGVLQVEFKNKVNIRKDNTEVYVTLPLLNYLQTNGDMAVSSTVSGSDQLKPIINGSASISIEAGNVNEFDGTITGNGNISAMNLQCNVANLNISGNGDIDLNVTHKLEATISGNGNVYYNGSPSITTHITAKGQVTPK